MGDGRLGVVVPAAGEGRRMGGRRKAFLELKGVPILRHVLRPFLSHPRVRAVVVALSPDDARRPPPWLADLDPRIRIVAGGATRLASVAAALEELPESVDVAMVHDAARPLVTREIIDRCAGATREGEGAVAGWPVVDTLKEVDEEGRIVDTPDRSRFWRAQTPQAFPRARLLEAYREALREGARATDDAAVFSRAGGVVRMVEGSPWNLKVTHPDDLTLAGFLMDLGRTIGAGQGGRDGAG